MKSRTRLVLNIFSLLALLVSLFGGAETVQAATVQIDIDGPLHSGYFGDDVVTLPNGNFVVTDPYYDAPGSIADAGAVYLYNGTTHALISVLTGSIANDRVGSDGLVVLQNGNYVVISSDWNNGAGAVTLLNQATGISGVVSSANSLVGSSPNDYVGCNGVIGLSNGNYVVQSNCWNNGAGAITWGSGISGVSGAVSASNSLIGSTANDEVGSYGVMPLENGNYIVKSPGWDGVAINVGAVTWGNGSGGTVGAVSAVNSLVGSTANDQIGFISVVQLANSNYVVSSPIWDNGSIVDAGAVTWGSGTSGVSGFTSTANSLVGSTEDDRIGDVVTALDNGNYVVGNRYWDNGAIVNAGAATWGNGLSGITGPVSTANSLYGTTAEDGVGERVEALTNGHYVVTSSQWDNGALVNVGAATWGNGSTGNVGAVSASNSLIGPSAYDYVGGSAVALTNGNYVVRSGNWNGVGAATWVDGSGSTSGTVTAGNSLIGSTSADYVGNYVYALTNGNYVVGSDVWDNGAAVDAGAVTLGNGVSGTTGIVSAANSLVGSTDYDYLGRKVVVLPNGNYVVTSVDWDNGAVVDAGSVTWGSGTTGVTGVVSAANSLVGSTLTDWVGSDIETLSNGNYVVLSPDWDNGAVENAGAATWGNGSTGIVGLISASNSLVGTHVDDYVGYDGVYENGENTGLAYYAASLTDNDYVVLSPYWDKGTVKDSGAITISRNSGTPTVGLITTANSVLGTNPLGGPDMDVWYDDVNLQLLVNRPADNMVTLFKDSPTFVDVPESYWAYGYIERLYGAAITSGCLVTPLTYCPDSTVTRAQMAVFLLKGIHGSSYTPPAINGNTGFGDVATDYWAAAWIKQLAAEGITSGCGAGIYCPDATVTRAQMAVFLLKAKNGSSYTPPAVGVSTGFADVATDYWAAAFIKQLVTDGITSGCGAGIYCPDAEVTRAQMAVFLVKAFNLP